MFYLIWAFPFYATLNIYSNHFKVFHIHKKKKNVLLKIRPVSGS